MKYNGAEDTTTAVSPLALSGGSPDQNTDALLQNLWTEVLKEFKAVLSPDQYQLLLGVQTVDHLTKELALREGQYKERLLPKLLARLDPIFQQLAFFSKCIGIFVQAKPEVAALVWGSVYALLELALRHKRHLDDITDILDHLAKHLPRIKSFTDLLVVSKRIGSAICSLYRELIQFFLHATVFFSRTPFLNILGIGPLNRPSQNQRFQAEFGRFLDSIRDSTHWIDTEANVALHTVAYDLTSRGHKEILSSISAMVAPAAPRHSTSVSYRILPHLANPNFFGRSSDLKALDEVLLPDRTTQLHIFSIFGEGGVGKSQLALQFAYSHFAEFNAIFWVSADTTVKIAQGYEDIAVELGIVKPSSDQSSLATVREATKRWFRTTDSIWLLIFDNVESLPLLDDYWPTGDKGSILITTRSQTLMRPPVTASRGLKCFTPQDGALFVLENIPPACKSSPESDHKDAALVSAACGGLPLALSQVIRHIQALHLSVADARKRFSTPDSFVSVDSELNRLGHADYYYQKTVAACWDTALQSLDSASLSLAQIVAHLDPDAIPEQFLTASSSSDLQSKLGTIAERHSQILALRNHSLILPGSRSNMFSMHRLVQATILGRLDPDQTSDLFRVVLGIIDGFFPKYDTNDRLVRSWQECGRVVPHVQRLVELFTTRSTASHSTHIYLKLGQLLERASWYFQERRSLPEAQFLLDASMDVAQRGLHLALVEESTSSTTSPETLAADALNTASNKELVTGFHALVADLTNSLGTLHLERGKFDSVLHNFFDAVKLREDAGRLDLEMIYMKRNVGSAYLSSNQIGEAYRAFKNSLDLMETWLSTADDPDRYRDSLASNLGSLSAALTFMGRLDEAWDMALKSTELCVQVHGPDSIILANCYTTLGRIRRLQGNLDDAEVLCRKALDIRQQLYGQHEGTALALHNYARVLKLKGDIDEALKIQEQSVNMMRTLPDSERALARAIFYYVDYQREQNGVIVLDDLDEAYHIYRKHLGSKAKSQADVQLEDFDNLLPHYSR